MKKTQKKCQLFTKSTLFRDPTFHEKYEKVGYVKSVQFDPPKKVVLAGKSAETPISRNPPPLPPSWGFQ